MNKKMCSAFTQKSMFSWLQSCYLFNLFYVVTSGLRYVASEALKTY